MTRQYSFQTGVRNTFHPVDYVLFGALLVICAGIGLFYAIKDRKRGNTKEYLLAGGNMSAIPVALSLLASFMSAITLLGTPAEMYNYTTIYWWIGVGYMITIALAAHIYIPVFFRLRITSAYEYLGIRFGLVTRSIASIIYIIQMVLYMSIVLYAPSLAINAVTDFSLWGAIWAVGLVCIFYTTLGGMKAVLWTDTFQVTMMIAGLLAVLIQGSIEVGGFSKAWEISRASGRIWFTDFDPDPIVRHSFWTCIFGGAFTWLSVYGANQAQIQRAITCPTVRKAQYAYWFNFPGLCVILILCALIGTVIYAFYETCDPKSFGLISASDQLLPLFVMDVLGHIPGIPGLFISCLFSGALSTLSSGLNSIAAVILEDCVKLFCFKEMSEMRATFASKILAVVFGFICIGLTYVASLLGSVLQAALALFGVIGGPLLGVFTLGMLFPWANQKGAVTGMVTSLAFMLWISIGYQIHKPKVATFSPINVTGCNWNLTTTPASVTSAIVTTTVAGLATTTPAAQDTGTDLLMRLYSLSYLWYSATAMIFVIGLGLIVSLITGRTDPKTLDPRLICPIFDVLMPFLPKRWRRRLWFGVRHDEVKDDEPVNDVELAVNKDAPRTKNGTYQTENGVSNQAYVISGDEKNAHPRFTKL